MPSAGTVVALVLSLLIAAFYAPLDANPSFDSALGDRQRVLLVTAHPDDEAMFFAPTILSLTKKRQEMQFFHVCLSNGNANGLGEYRGKELGYSLDILGVARQNRWLLNHPELQDDITLEWDSGVIANVLNSYVSGLKIDTILTFDSHGVSGHPNHKAIPAGVKTLLTTLNSTSPPPRLFTLVSAPLQTKYCGFLSVAVAKVELLRHRWMRTLKRALTDVIPIRGSNVLEVEEEYAVPFFVSDFGQYLTALSAMLSHHSQMVWYRWFYISYSRYMWTNIWQEISLS